MKISELKEVIKQFDDDMEVVLQKDSEGNGYSPLADVDGDAIYIAESTWEGDVYSAGWTADDACMEPDEWEEFKASNPKCVVLAPVN